MFLVKNIYLSKKLGIQIRGKNIEAIASTIFFVLIIVLALSVSYFDVAFGRLDAVNENVALYIGIFGVFLSTFISGASLVGLRDSWRVGVIEEQRTELVTSGIYKYSRNPYFTSYILMFFSYSILLQNLFLLVCTVISIFLVHKMVLKEESYLYSIHGGSFLEYKKSTPRYLVI